MTNDETNKSTNPFNSLPGWAKLAIPIGVVVVLAFALFLVKNGVTNDGNRREAALNSQYLDNQNYLSDCIVRITESANVAQGGVDALDEVLTDAIAGRYDQGSSAQVGQGQLFSAMVEAYPDLSQIGDSFDNVMTVVNGCRSDYRSQQSKLLDMLASYDKWRTGSWTVRTFGGDYPSNNLVARRGDTVERGQEALDRMFSIVLVGEAADAYQTGELETIDPFADDGEG